MVGDDPVEITARSSVAGTAKRLLDIVGATVGLIVLSPILLLAMVAIKFTSPGPAIFRQTREGRGGKPFTIFKLRTMVIDAEQKQAALRAHSHRDGPAFKVEGDPRVTPVGEFLRKTCIDELPQLINVLLGDMSLVGPRPPSVARESSLRTVAPSSARYSSWHDLPLASQQSCREDLRRLDADGPPLCRPTWLVAGCTFDIQDGFRAALGSWKRIGMNAIALSDSPIERGEQPSVMPARVVFLTHFIPLYQVRVLQEIARSVRDFHVLLSTPIEPNRQFEIDWGDLDVQVQKTLTFRRSWRQSGPSGGPGFTDPLFVHVPYDTRARLKQLKPDIVMSLELGARSLGAVRYCHRHNAKSIVCTYMSEHTEQARGWMRERLRKHLIHRADAITYNGPSCQSYLQRLGADPQRLYRLSYAADDRTAHQGTVERDEVSARSRVLYVGQLSERKGVIPLMNQLNEYCRLNKDRLIELRMAGRGPLRDEIERFDLAENLTIRLLGNLAPADLAAEMGSCGVTVAPTLADEWLLVVNEALQAGLPVIGSIYAQATISLIRDGENGWQYDPAQPKSLHAVLDQYFGISNGEISRMRHACRDSISHCTPAWAAKEAIRAIANLIGHSNEPHE